MQELINRMTEKAGISTEQANKALETIKDFVIEKFPMMAGAVENLFGPSATEATTTATTTAGATAVVVDPEAPKVAEANILDKISDVIPGEAGQKVEDFAKTAAHKAEDIFGDVKDKLTGLFGDKK